MAARDLSHLSIAYFSHTCNVPIGKVWQLPVRAQGVCKPGGGKYEGDRMRGAPNMFLQLIMPTSWMEERMTTNALRKKKQESPVHSILKNVMTVPIIY